MPRGPRLDLPGRIFHVMNRGTARRTMFERPADFRYFLSRLARSVRRREIDILAYALVTTHFHLVVRSHGQLSEAMRRIQFEYVRYFNRSRRRDGSLQRGRFLSKPVTSQLYLANLVPYVDENPVQARLVDRVEDWPWSSAGARARGRHGQWLSPDVAHLARGDSTPETRAARAGYIDARLAARASESAYESLVAMAPARVAQWMRRKAQLADGTEPGVPVACPHVVRDAIESELGGASTATILLAGARRQRAAELLDAGLLRELASASFASVARSLATSEARAKRLHRLHLRALQEDPAYLARAARIVAGCLGRLVAPGDRRILV